MEAIEYLNQVRKIEHDIQATRDLLAEVLETMGTVRAMNHETPMVDGVLLKTSTR